jgi:hypothetical protein
VKRPDNLRPEGAFQDRPADKWLPGERPTVVRHPDNLMPEGQFQGELRIQFIFYLIKIIFSYFSVTFFFCFTKKSIVILPWIFNTGFKYRITYCFFRKDVFRIC